MTDHMADAIVVNCEFVRRHLRMNEGVPGERMRLCYNGVDLDQFPSARDSARCARHRRGLRAAAGEGCQERLIEAFARIRRPGLRLLIVGSGSMLGELRSVAAAPAVWPAIAPSFPPPARWPSGCARSTFSFCRHARRRCPIRCSKRWRAAAVRWLPAWAEIVELIRHGENGMLFEAATWIN